MCEAREQSCDFCCIRFGVEELILLHKPILLDKK